MDWSWRWWFDGMGARLGAGRLLGLVVVVGVLVVAAVFLGRPEDRSFVVVLAVLLALAPPSRAVDQVDRMRKGQQPKPGAPPVRPAGWYRFVAAVALAV